jgi:nucleotide-binding universal stress UspA family protein
MCHSVTLLCDGHHCGQIITKQQWARKEINMKTAAAKSAIGFRNILFATDFSPAAARAVPYVKKIAKHYDAALVALHVRTPVVNPMTEPATWPSYLEAAQAQDQQRREELLAAFAGISTQVLIEEGSIEACLSAAIEKNNTDLVVIGTRGRTGIEKLLLGSVAEEIFRTVSCPVLTVGPRVKHFGRPDQIREILYATDFSPESQNTAAYAVSLAQEFQARLVLLHVIAPQRPGELISAADLQRASEKLLQEVVPPQAQDWCKPEFHVLEGDVPAKILEFADLREPDLIILGVRQKEGVPGAASHLPLGTAHKVVSQANCPVLTIRH